MTTAATEPRRLGRYELLFVLAQGGMGEVHLAKLTGAAGFEKLCIVKTILPNMQADPQFVDRFHHEARVLVQLNHSNIAQVYDMGEVDGTLYMAIEYVAGVDLSRVLSRVSAQGSLLQLPVGVYLGRQICEALDYAHRKAGPEGAPLGIVHRDVSPQNVMVSYEGEVKVIDFGLAKSSVRSQHTLPSTVMGKLGYMSPEQAMAQPVDLRSDIYSAGIVIWEMFAGRPAFGGATMGELLAMMANPSIPSLRSVRPEVSETLDRAVMRALEKDPARRYPRAEEFSRALNELSVREGLGVSSEDVGNTLRAMCSEEYASERRLQSHLSTLRKRASSPGVVDADGAAERLRLTDVKPGVPLGSEGTMIRSTGEAMTPAQRALSVATATGGLASPLPGARTSVVALPSTVPPSLPPSGASSTETPVVRRSRAPLLAVLVGGVALAAGGAFVLLSKAEPEPKPEVVLRAEPAPKAEPVKEAEVRPVAAAPELRAAKADPSAELVEVSGPVFHVISEDHKAYIILEKGQSLSEGDRLRLVGEPQDGTRRPLYGTAAVLEVKKNIVMLLVDHELALPAELFASPEASPRHAGGARGAAKERREEPVAEAGKRPSSRARLEDEEPPVARRPSNAPTPVPAAAVGIQPVPFPAQGAPVPPTSNPEPGQAARQPAPEPAAAAPTKQLVGSIRMTNKMLFGRVMTILNSNAFTLSGCEIRLPDRRTYRFGNREVLPPRESLEVEERRLTPDPRPPLAEFAQAWALVVCREGGGWMRTVVVR